MGCIKCNFIIKNIDLFVDAWSLQFYEHGNRILNAYIDEGLAKTLENLGVKANKIKYQKKYCVRFTETPKSVKESEFYTKRKSEPCLILAVTDDRLSGPYDIYVELYETEFNGNRYVKPYYEIINTREGS